MLGLVVAAVVSLAYAAWAFTSRRAIFADFSAGRTVTPDDARASDTIDTFLLVVAGITVVVAVALWLARLARRRTRGGGLLLTGLTLTAVGVVVVAVGIWLDGSVANAATQSAQGLRGVTATVVCGSGFAVLALGLLLGATVVRGPGEAQTPTPPGPATGRPWQP
jgi:ABC-type multidrug transport system permease subunit